MDYIKHFEAGVKKLLDDFIAEIRSIKAGQASPALIEDANVSCYDGQVMQLKQVAAISVSSLREMMVQPWDKSLISNIAKAIEDLSGGMQALPDKNNVRVILPMLTEERRKEFVKLVHHMGEETRVKMRRERDEINKGINDIAAEDERFRTKEHVDEIIKRAQKDIDEATVRKEKELLSF